MAFIEQMSNCKSMDWLAVLPRSMRKSSSISKWLNSERCVWVQKTSLFDIARIGVRLTAIEREFKPNIVFTIFGPAYFKARAPHVVGFALPNLIYERTGPLKKAAGLRTLLSDKLRRAMLRRADHFVVETETVRMRLAHRLGTPLEVVSVIGNAVNPVMLKYDRNVGPGGGACRILIPSTYYVHKNLEVVPFVARALRDLDSNFDFIFQFTLDRESGPWASLIRSAAACGVSDRIETLGVLQLDRLAVAYQRASAVFLPTLREASTAVYPESFYFRRPLITSDLDFARELCGEAALYVPPLEPEKIAEAILHLASDEDLAAHLIGCGEERLSTGFPSAEVKFAQQIEVLTAVSSRCRRAWSARDAHDFAPDSIDETNPPEPPQW